MYHRVKGLLIGFLLLLPGCNSAPVNVRGELLADAPFKWLYDDDKIELAVWACPKSSELSKIYKDMEQSGLGYEAVNTLSKYKMLEKIKSSDSCIKAKISEDNRNYSIDNVPLGRYEIVAFSGITSNLQTAVTDYHWWLVPVNIRDNKTVDLLYKEAHLSR